MSTDETDAPASDDAGVETEQGRQGLSALSNEMVRIYKDQFGRGPTRVRSHYAGPDTLICLLEQTFTPAEKNLQAMGEHTRLRDTRTFFQYASTADFVGAAQRITGRRVRSFISGIDVSRDVSAEMFLLEPLPQDGGSRESPGDDRRSAEE